MKREWFLLIDLETSGPFNLAEVEELIKKGQIKVNALIKNMDGADWIPIVKVEAFSQFFPDLEILENIKTPRKIDIQSTDSLAESPELEYEEKQEFTLKEYKLPKKFINKKEHRFSVKTIGLVSVTLLISMIVFLSIYLLNSKEQKVEYDFSEIEASLQEELKIITEIKSKDVNIKFALNKNESSEIYVVTNTDNAFYIEAEFKPVVESLTVDNFKNYILKQKSEKRLSKFKLNENINVGVYKFHANLIVIPKWISFLGLNENSFFEKFHRNISLAGEAKLIQTSMEKHIEEIQKIKKIKLKLKQKPFLDKIGRLETFLQNLEQTWMALEDNLKYLKNGNDIKTFEEFYRRQPEIIFQRLINQEDNVDEKSLILFQNTLDLLETKILELKQLKKFNKNKRQELIKSINEKILDIQRRGQERIDEIKKIIPNSL